MTCLIERVTCASVVVVFTLIDSSPKIQSVVAAAQVPITVEWKNISLKQN